MQPLASIVIPTYKRPDQLKRAIDSVLAQSYSNTEIIVVDDNDPGDKARSETEQVMLEYANNARIKYIKHDKNKNGSAARNTGWRASEGKYITFMDDDDEISPRKIEEQVTCLDKLDETWGACYTGYHVLRANGTCMISSERRSGYLYIEALMRSIYVGSGSNLLLRKSVVDEIGGYDESFRRNQDLEFMARALENYKLAYINEDLLTIHYEDHRSNVPYKQMEDTTVFYLKKFDQRISALKPKDRKRVLMVIALESSRFALKKKYFKKAAGILLKNKVSIPAFFKYILYMLHRAITKKSYGFSL